MFTADLDEKAARPLYEQLYGQLRHSIEQGALKQGEKLPSKRKLAAHLQVSQHTVENAYAQLVLEGYVEARQRSGYFVCPLMPLPAAEQTSVTPLPSAAPAAGPRFDLRTNAVGTEHFPFALWSKLLRQSLRDEQAELLRPIPPQGELQLRREIASYLRQFRSMTVLPEQVVLGAGTEYLLGLVSELLPGQTFALEDPNYHKPARLLASRGVPFVGIPLDGQGLRLDCLRQTEASVVFTTPSHHFPLGTVMSVSRRHQLLQWAKEAPLRFLIEDDYDSEFRYALKPVPSLHSLGGQDQVIYLNTFTRTLAPSLRIAYLVLPPRLLRRFQQRLLFYACTVSEFEQSTLRRFLAGGYYERHLSRMRLIYKNRRDALLRGLAPLAGQVQISGQEAGLHLLLRAQNGLSEAALVARAAAQGVGVYGLSLFYLQPPPETHTVMLGYADYDEAALSEAAALLVEAWRVA